MEEWLIPCNIKKYDVINAFEVMERIHWKQSRNLNKLKINDIVFIYVSKPISGVLFKCIVRKVNLPENTIDDKKFILDGTVYENYDRYMELELLIKYNKPINLDELKRNGLSGNPQGPRRLTKLLSTYLKSKSIDTKPQGELGEILTQKDYFEGRASLIYVNKYERNITARNLAIAYHGCKCYICEFDFEETYGKLGKGYIQVHHVVPIHTIGKDYKVDYKKDLLPICPNCHAMIHKKIEGKELSVEELKSLIN